MVSQYAQSLTGIPWLGTVVMFVAIAGFAAIVWWTFRLKNEEIDRMSRLPLEGERTPDQETIA